METHLSLRQSGLTEGPSCVPTQTLLLSPLHRLRMQQGRCVVGEGQQPLCPDLQQVVITAG